MLCFEVNFMLKLGLGEYLSYTGFGDTFGRGEYLRCWGDIGETDFFSADVTRTDWSKQSTLLLGFDKFGLCFFRREE